MSNFKGATHQKKHGKKQSTKFCAKYELVLPNENDGTELYVITRPLGNGRFMVSHMETSEIIQASITRSFKKGPTKEILGISDTVLIQSGISKDQYFIVHRYSKSDIEELRRLGLVKIETNLTLNPTQDDGLDFGDLHSLDADNDNENLLNDL